MTYQLAIRRNEGLTNDDLAHRCPAVLATTAHQSRSQRYLYIPTIQILEGLRNEGFVLTEAMQSRSRIEGKEEYTKHLLRFRRAGIIPRLNEEFAEMVLENSHDGTSGYKLMVGIFRLVCTNGLVRKQDEYSYINITHRGNQDTLRDVIEGTYRIIEEAERTMGDVELMKQIMLNRSEQLFLARHAMPARFDMPDDDPNVVEGSFVPATPPEKIPHPMALLGRRRRYGDESTDLWTTMNVVQENLLKGGVSRPDGKKTKVVRSIDKNLTINQVVWAVGEELKRFKLEGGTIPEEEMEFAY